MLKITGRLSKFESCCHAQKLGWVKWIRPQGFKPKVANELPRKKKASPRNRGLDRRWYSMTQCKRTNVPTAGWDHVRRMHIGPRSPRASSWFGPSLGLGHCRWAQITKKWSEQFRAQLGSSCNQRHPSRSWVCKPEKTIGDVTSGSRVLGWQCSRQVYRSVGTMNMNRDRENSKP